MNICRQCFRERAAQIGFEKVRQGPYTTLSPYTLVEPLTDRRPSACLFIALNVWSDLNHLSSDHPSLRWIHVVGETRGGPEDRKGRGMVVVVCVMDT